MGTMTLAERITHDFGYHPPPTIDVGELHDEIRAALRGAALFIAKKTPAGREQSLALTKLEEAMMWANAAVARNSSGLVVAGSSGEAVVVTPSA